MFSNESTESLNTMGSSATATATNSNTMVTISSNGDVASNDSNSTPQKMKKSASSSFTISSCNKTASPLQKSPPSDDNFENTVGGMTRDPRSVPNLGNCSLQSNNDDSSPTGEYPPSAYYDSIELLNFADANEVPSSSTPSSDESPPTDSDQQPPSISITTTAIIENNQQVNTITGSEIRNNEMKQLLPTRSDSAYTFQSYDCSSRSSTLSSTAANVNDTSSTLKQKTLSRPMKVINGKYTSSKASCQNSSSGGGLNGSQVKLIDLEDEEEEDEESGYPANYFNSTDDLNDFSSLSGYESIEGGINYENLIASPNVGVNSKLPSSLPPASTNEIQPSMHHPTTTTSPRNHLCLSINDSRSTNGRESRLSFANPHYMNPDVKSILEKRSGGIGGGATSKANQLSNVFGERIAGKLKRDDLSHENFAQALNSPADSLVSDYHDFQARLNHDLVELKDHRRPIPSRTMDNTSSHYYQAVEEEEMKDVEYIDDGEPGELVQLRTKPSKTIHTPSMTPQPGRKFQVNGGRPNRPLSTGSISSAKTFDSVFATNLSNSSANATSKRCLPDQPGNGKSQRNGGNLPKRYGNDGQPTNRNQLKLLMFIVGGREIGQVTVFKRPISMWKLDLTKTF